MEKINSINRIGRKIRPDRKKVIRLGIMFAVLAAVLASPDLAVFAKDAGTSAVTEKFTALKTLVEGIITGIGTIITLWGLAEWGIAFQGSEGTMQAQAIKRIGGGMIMVLAPQLLSLLV